MKNTTGGRRKAKMTATETAAKVESGENISRPREKVRHGRGFFIGLGIVSGTIFGLPYGLLMANPDILWVGMVIGTALGAMYEQRYNHSLDKLFT